MSFKHNGKSAHEWKKWVEENKEKLINAGVPEEIYTKEIRWLRFLEEGYDFEKEWGPENLNQSEAVALHDFVKTNYGNVEYRGLLHDIEVKFNVQAT